MGGKLIVRDLAGEPLPHLDAERFQAFVAQARTPAQQALVDLSDRLIAELKEADVILIGLPMYNFSVPSTLRAYFDHVARVGVTFKYTVKGSVGLLTGKKQSDAGFRTEQVENEYGMRLGNQQFEEFSALCRETLRTGVPSESAISVSPLKYQLKSASPPSPSPFSGLSFGPATKPSSDIVMLKTTFPITFPYLTRVILDS